MFYSGIFHFPWWGYALIALALTHVTIIAVTIYLHRHQTHRALDLHPLVGHFFRFWLWLTTGMVTREWVAVHRKHHAKVETPDDPHSPQVYGIWRVLFLGVFLYVKAAHDRDTLPLGFGHDGASQLVITTGHDQWHGIVAVFERDSPINRWTHTRTVRN